MFLGMRNEESNGRSKYGDIWKNNKWDEEWNGILPIRKWKELDVWLYTLHNNIEINPKYKKGYARVGCAIACPFYTKSVWALDKYWYRSMYDRLQKILADDFLYFSNAHFNLALTSQIAVVQEQFSSFSLLTAKFMFM